MKTEDILSKMQEPLPAKAYKKHPTKSFLTTISSAYTRERLTNTFGLYGFGWGLRWNVEDCEHWTSETAKGKTWYHFFLRQAIFWFKMDGEIIEFPVTGYGDNDNLGDAAEGAQTNAINLGAKRLLFQLHIYKDEPAASPSQMTKVEFFTMVQNKLNLTPDQAVEILRRNDFINGYHPENVNAMLDVLKQSIGK